MSHRFYLDSEIKPLGLDSNATLQAEMVDSSDERPVQIERKTGKPHDLRRTAATLTGDLL